MKDDHIGFFPPITAITLLRKSQVGAIMESKGLFAANILATQFLAGEKMEGFRSDSECLQFSFFINGRCRFLKLLKKQASQSLSLGPSGLCDYNCCRSI